jgi:hypothetical protein
MRNYLILSVVTLITSGCDYYDFKLTVVNNSGTSISVQSVQDTLLRIEAFNDDSYYLAAKIPTGTSRKLMKGGKNSWSGGIEYSTNKKLNLIVFKTDSLAKYKSVIYMLENKMFQQYSFSKTQLDEMEWKIEVKD